PPTSPFPYTTLFRSPSLLRATPGQVIALARDTHQPAHALNHKVIAWQGCHGPSLAKASNRAVNQAGIDLLHGLVIQTIFFETAYFEVFYQNIAVFGQLAYQFSPFGL